MAAADLPPSVGLLYDERMCAHATPNGDDHPENPERLRAIWRKLNSEGITSRCVVLKAKEAEDKYIASVHSQDHIKLMKEISLKKYNPSRSKIASKYNSIYFNKGSSESAVLAAGSVIEVAEKVAAGELSSAIALVRPPGHHAEHDKAMGFCLFNNVAVAANYLLNERPNLGIKKILIVDWDVHHGNATQKMFYSDPRVLFFSVHRFDSGDFYPCKMDASYCFIGEEAGKGYNINVPWEHGNCGDADYLAAWDHILLPVTEAFGPDIILVSAGFDAALGDPLGGCCVTPDGYALLLTKLLGFAQGRTVMALEGGYNLESTANSVLACAKVLLGDKFTFEALEKQPFESTWRVIQAVRNELKTCWPVLSAKLPENVSPREVCFPLSPPACPVPKESQAVRKWGHGTSAPATSATKSVPLWVQTTGKGEGPCMSYRTHHVEGSGESKRRRLGGDEVGEMESKGDRLDDYDVRAESAIRNNESLPQLQFPQGICTVGKGTSGVDELDHEKPERKDEQGAFGDQIPSPPRPAPVMAPSKVAESLGHLNTLRGTSGQEDTAAGQGQLSSLRATCGQVSQGLSFDGLALEDFKLPPEARDALATVAPQLHSTELASPEHLAAQLEAVAWKQLVHVKALHHSHRQWREEMAGFCRAKEVAELKVSELEAAREEMREEMAGLRRAKEAAELKVFELEARLKQGEEARERAEDSARVANKARESTETSVRQLRRILRWRDGELRQLWSAQAAARSEREGWAKTANKALRALFKALGDLGVDGAAGATLPPVDSLGSTLRWLRKAAQMTPKFVERYGSSCARIATSLALTLLHSGGCTHLGSVARPDLSCLTSKRKLRNRAEVWEAYKGFRKNAWERVGRRYALRWILCRKKLKSGAHAQKSGARARKNGALKSGAHGRNDALKSGEHARRSSGRGRSR